MDASLTRTIQGNPKASKRIDIALLLVTGIPTAVWVILDWRFSILVGAIGFGFLLGLQSAASMSSAELRKFSAQVKATLADLDIEPRTDVDVALQRAGLLARWEERLSAHPQINQFAIAILTAVVAVVIAIIAS